MIAATALVLIISTAAPAPADEGDAAKAKAAFQAAQKLYKQAKYTEAIGKFEEAYRLKPHPSIFFNIGRCYEQLSELPKALRNYRDYLKAMPDAKDKDTVTEAIVNLEQRLKDQGVQQVIVYSDPAGAAVTVDGKKYGQTPSSTELKPGNHSLTLTKDGFESVEKAFVMPADKSMELSVALKAGSGTSTAASKPGETKPGETKPAETATSTTTAGEPPPTPPPAVVAQAPSDHALRGKAWIPAAAGAALLIGGGVFYGLAISTNGRFTSNDKALLDPAVRSAAKSSGSLDQTLGFVLGGVGIAAVAAAATMFFLPIKGGTSVSVIAGPNMAGAAFSGEFP